MERAERMYEDDFMSFFDDAYDAAVATSDHSHSTDQSESDEGRQKLPRRNRTFSGVGEHRKGGSYGLFCGFECFEFFASFFAYLIVTSEFWFRQDS